MSEPLELSGAFRLQNDYLVLDYEVSNRASRDVYLLNRLYRTAPRWEIGPDIVYIRLDSAAETVWMSKGIAEMPKGVMVNAPVAPFVTPLRAGGTFREQVHVRLPVRAYSEYNVAPGRPSPARAQTFKRVSFTLGFYWRSEGGVEETRDVHGVPMILPRTPPGKRTEFGEARTAVVNLEIPVLIESDGASGEDADVSSRQVLAEAFRNLVRYALRKTNRDELKLGVTPEGFSAQAVETSLAARANGRMFEAQEAPSLKTLLRRAHEPLTFQFYWMAPSARAPLEAAFALSYEPDGDFKVRLLWLALPERVPVAYSAATPGGPKPLEEAVMELLRVLDGGRLAPYPPPG